MAVNPTYPGVYIQEVPSGVRTIAGVSTSIAAFVGYFPRGLLNTAVRVLNPADFEREFGGLHADSEASYGIQQFFLNGGTEAWVVRVGFDNPGGTPFRTASAVFRDGPGGSEVVRVRAGRRIRGTSRENPGQWGNNLRVEVDFDTTRPEENEFFNLRVTEVEERRGRLVNRQVETFLNLTMREGAPNNAIQVVNARSRLIQLDRNDAWTDIPDPPIRPMATGTLGSILQDPAGIIPGEGDTFTVNFPGGSADCEIEYEGQDAPDSWLGFRPTLEAAIRRAGNDPLSPIPALAGASVEVIPTGQAATPHRYRVLAGRADPGYQPRAILTFAETGGNTAEHLGLGPGHEAANVQQYALGGTDAGAQSDHSQLSEGSDGELPGAQELQGTLAAKSGFHALEEVDLFNILCIPRAADLGGNDMHAVYAAAERYCEQKRAFLILDIPRDTQTVDAMTTWLSENAGLRHTNAAVYFPRPRIADRLNQYRLRSAGGSGTVAGLCARTDASRGVWKAPAGTEASLRNVQELSAVLTDRENGVLNPLGVNCLRNLPVYGNICWGARTLMGADAQASEWKYVPIRRLALYLEESLYRGLQWVVFEPNDEPLWAQIRLNAGAFMHDLHRQGAFQGQKPSDAYFVKCDGETTTQTDRDRGMVNIWVGFAPLKPAEFVVLYLQQIAGQIEV